ncbi:MAG: Rab family GTPase [Leucothrix sp.]
MVQKKICLLGAFAVGKTSLVLRYVNSIFGEKYHTTVGVKIDKKQLTVNEQAITLMIWDLAGQDELTRLRTSYLRGVAGYVIVVDGTRPLSIDTAITMHQEAREYTGDVPFIIAINKADLKDEWQVDALQLKKLEDEGVTIILTSAKTGDGVEETFQLLAENLLNVDALPNKNENK